MHDEQNEPTPPNDTASSETLPSPVRKPEPALSQASMAPDAEVAAHGHTPNPQPGSPVAKLRSANMPADRGITSLALLMQLGGTIGIVVAALFALAMALSGAGQIAGPFFLVAVLSGIRSAFHRTAGTNLLYGEGGDPLRSVFTYVGVSVGQAAISLLILKNFLEPVTLAQFAAFFLGWPAAVLVFFGRPKIRTLLSGGVPHAEDYGFEGAAVLMTLFGIIGTLCAGYILKVLLSDVDAAFATPATGIVVLTFIALVARSVIHTLAGFKGISGAGFEECNASAARYYNFGIISSVCIGVTFFVVVLMTSQSVGAALIMAGIAMPLLLAWPQILKRLYSERNFHVFLSGSEAQTFQRAPDAGLIALGWILVALGVLGLGMSLAEALLGQPLTPDDLWLLAQTTGEGGIEHATRSPWWSVGVSALQLWAGVELVRMSARHKLAAMIYAVVSIGVVLYLVWPAIDSLGGLFSSFSTEGAVMQQGLFLITGFPLVLAIGTIVLVNRVAVPTAVVHTRRDEASRVQPAG